MFRVLSLMLYVKIPFQPPCNNIMENEHSHHISIFIDKIPPLLLACVLFILQSFVFQTIINRI
jgi:hypothetical protein